MLKTFVVGASGLIGHAYWLTCRQRFPDCIGTQHARVLPDLVRFDLLQPDLASLALRESAHEGALIAAACTRVAACDQEPEKSRRINVDGTACLVRQLDQYNLPVLFLSSDYVFSGVTGGYDESAHVGPTTEYGRQKVELEQQIGELHRQGLVVRLSKVYGLQHGDGTLLDEMAKELVAGRPMTAADDQIFCPTFVDDVVRVLGQLQEQAVRGVIHVCHPEPCSRYELALALAEALDVDPRLVRRVSLHTLPGMQNRPLNTSMSIKRLEQISAPEFLSWRTAVRRVAANYQAIKGVRPV